MLKNEALVSHQSDILFDFTKDQVPLDLSKLMKFSARVFGVHLLPGHASHFFKVANEAVMMDKGYAWLLLSLLTNFLVYMDLKLLEAMQGLMDVVASVPVIDDLVDCKKSLSPSFHYTNRDKLSVIFANFGAWAFDSIAALAVTIGQDGVISLRLSTSASRGNQSDMEAVGTSGAALSLIGWNCGNGIILNSGPENAVSRWNSGITMSARQKMKAVATRQMA